MKKLNRATKIGIVIYILGLLVSGTFAVSAFWLVFKTAWGV